MLRDVSERDTSVELFGRRLAVAVHARAGRRARDGPPRRRPRRRPRRAPPRASPMVISNQASTPMEEIARRARRHAALVPAVLVDLERPRRELRRAAPRRAGCEAIVVTLDTTMLGWRTRDLDLAYLPFLRGKGIAQYTSDPVFHAAARRRRSTRTRPAPRPTPAAIATLVQIAAQLPRPSARQARAGRGPALHAHLLAPVADLGRPAVPARADQAADPAQGHPAPRRRAPRGRRGHRRHHRLQPRRPPGRRRDRDDRGAARRRRGGRRPHPGPARLRRPRRRRRRSRRSRSAPARC